MQPLGTTTTEGWLTCFDKDDGRYVYRHYLKEPLFLPTGTHLFYEQTDLLVVGIQDGREYNLTMPITAMTRFRSDGTEPFSSPAYPASLR